MGRYYNGDIEGKLWFGVQSSCDASFFGVEPNEPSYLEYCFSEVDLEEIELGIKQCRKELKGYSRKLTQFFNEVDGYTNTQLAEHLGIGETKTKSLLVWYARLKLGLKIFKCVKKQGECEFSADI